MAWFWSATNKQIVFPQHLGEISGTIKALQDSRTLRSLSSWNLYNSNWCQRTIKADYVNVNVKTSFSRRIFFNSDMTNDGSFTLYWWFIWLLLIIIKHSFQRNLHLFADLKQNNFLVPYGATDQYLLTMIPWEQFLTDRDKLTHFGDVAGCSPHGYSYSFCVVGLTFPVLRTA